MVWGSYNLAHTVIPSAPSLWGPRGPPEGHSSCQTAPSWFCPIPVRPSGVNSAGEGRTLTSPWGVCIHTFINSPFIPLSPIILVVHAFCLLLGPCWLYQGWCTPNRAPCSSEDFWGCHLASAFPCTVFSWHWDILPWSCMTDLRVEREMTSCDNKANSLKRMLHTP